MKLQELYLKVSQFEQDLSKQYQSKLQCKKKCSQCCYVDLSVFKIEADHIRLWFKNLSNEEKSEFNKRLQEIGENREDFSGTVSSPCTFLKDDECIIYPVRPLICRTQGHTLAIKTESEQYLDICPLNEEAFPLAKKSDIINLELLNTILVQLNSLQENSETRIALKALAKEFTVQD